MIKQSITCDVCGKEKQQTNHWWMVMCEWKAGSPFCIFAWDIARNHDETKHLCGQECVNKAVSQWMQEAEHVEQKKI